MSMAMGTPEYGMGLEEFYRMFLEDVRGDFVKRNIFSGHGLVARSPGFVSYNRDSSKSVSILKSAPGYSWGGRLIKGNVRGISRIGDNFTVTYGIPEKSISGIRGMASDMKFYVEPQFFSEGRIHLYHFDPSTVDEKIEEYAVLDLEKAQFDASNPVPAMRLLEKYWKENPATSWAWSVSGPDGI